ncbi:hypothetical protein QQZ08_007937 [Neonectria magnoliae]|uniref:Fungal-specific transcription factor domain-containing protein n=1 Tax=Neonectria magnoliae TaxID=2732573 RepID=A0ABR1HXU4_9HYPO
MDASIPNCEAAYQRPNAAGSCWTCVAVNATCDSGLPGYASRLQWPEIQSPRRLFNLQTGADRHPERDSISCYRKPCEIPNRFQSSIPEGVFLLITDAALTIPSALSSFGVPAHEGRLLQHFAKNIARIALAIDYEGNVYRSIVSMAMSDQALLNSILAASSSHLSRWQNTPDTCSAVYTRRALVELENRLCDPVTASSESTLATMLCLISVEAGNGSRNWKHHYGGLEGWLRWRGDTLRLDPFLKSWIFLAAYQAALVFDQEPIAEIRRWLDAPDTPESPSKQVIDPFLGYSVKLPKLLLKAASLQKARANSTLSAGAIQCQVVQLQQEIAACRLDLTKPVLLASSCQRGAFSSVVSTSLGQRDLWRRAGATAEIFRHAAHIYLHRICAGSGEPLPMEIQMSVDSILELLSMIPDTQGPGSNLAWPLFVVGLEVNSVELRDMILDRWESLHQLGMKSTRGTERVLVEAWRCHDKARTGTGEAKHWQTVMHQLGEEQMVV